MRRLAAGALIVGAVLGGAHIDNNIMESRQHNAKVDAAQKVKHICGGERVLAEDGTCMEIDDDEEGPRHGI